ncbi:hypothetical protein D3C87_2037440 [compost metagenome]
MLGNRIEIARHLKGLDIAVVGLLVGEQSTGVGNVALQVDVVKAVHLLEAVCGEVGNGP